MDGEVAAAMAAFPAAEADIRARRFLRLLLWRSPPWTWRTTLRVYRLGAEVTIPPPAGTLYVDSLATSPRHRRRGAARALLAGAERRARVLGLDAVSLETDLGNERARALYESAGFEKAGERPPKGGLPGFVAYVKPVREPPPPSD
jgi:ribosomal protein S18 acetylase RimI-like enzyme